jgi:hypothetical protein
MAGDISISRKRDSFPVPQELSLDAFFAARPWSFGPVNGPSVEARVVIATEQADEVCAMLPAHVAHRRLEDGRLLIRPLVRDAGALFDWLLPLAGAAEVLGPSDLRAQYAVRLETTSLFWQRS